MYIRKVVSPYITIGNELYCVNAFFRDLGFIRFKDMLVDALNIRTVIGTPPRRLVEDGSKPVLIFIYKIWILDSSYFGLQAGPVGNTF